jgi:hypothetical protein
MIRYGNPQEVVDYFADGSVNQSYLKQLLKGVDNLGEKEETLYFKEKGHFKIGSATDVWITQGKAQYDAQFYCSESTKISDAIKSMVKMIFDSAIFDGVPFNNVLEEVPDGYIEEALNYHNYQGRWKTETRIAKVVTEGAEYFESLREAHGKEILTEVEGNLVHSIVMSINSGKYTAEYFKDSKDIDIYYQVPIFFTYMDIPCKILVDMIRVDRVNKTVEPIDIKTLGDNTVNFPWAVRSRGYHIQGAFYKIGINLLVKDMATCGVDMKISEYATVDFKFIVETTKLETNALTGETRFFTGKPLVYQMSAMQDHIALYGRPELSVVGSTGSFLNPTLGMSVMDMSNEEAKVYPIKHRAIKGIKDAIELHKWHTEHGFDEDKSVAESGGVILVE